MENALFCRSREHSFGPLRDALWLSFLCLSTHMVAWSPKVLSTGKQKHRVLSVSVEGPSLEDLALVEGLPHMFKIAFPCKVLLHHGFALLAVWVQLPPLIWFIVCLPVRWQLGGKSKKCLLANFQVKWTDNMFRLVLRFVPIAWTSLLLTKTEMTGMNMVNNFYSPIRLRLVPWLDTALPNDRGLSTNADIIQLGEGNIWHITSIV